VNQNPPSEHPAERCSSPSTKSNMVIDVGFDPSPISTIRFLSHLYTFVHSSNYSCLSSEYPNIFNIYNVVNEDIRILIYQFNIVISTIDPPPNDLLGQVKVRSPSMSLHETPSGTVVGQGMFFCARWMVTLRCNNGGQCEPLKGSLVDWFWIGISGFNHQFIFSLEVFISILSII